MLRPAPETIGLHLDANGWAEVDELLARARARAAGRHIDLDTLRSVVAEHDKQRFSLSEDGRRIRAAQGHLLGPCGAPFVPAVPMPPAPPAAPAVRPGS